MGTERNLNAGLYQNYTTYMAVYLAFLSIFVVLYLTVTLISNFNTVMATQEVLMK